MRCLYKPTRFLMTRSQHCRAGQIRCLVAGEGLPRRRRCDPGKGADKTKIVFPRQPDNPTGTYLPHEEVRRLHQGLPAHTRCWCWTLLFRILSTQRLTRPAGTSRHHRNTVIRAPSPRFTALAALPARLVLGRPSLRRRADALRGPFTSTAPVAVSGFGGSDSIGRISRRPWRTRELAVLDHRRIEKLCWKVNAKRRNFILIPFPAERAAMPRLPTRC